MPPVVGGSAAGADERLRRIEAVTEAALTHVELDELLAELLERIRDALRVDTAAVLLVDPHAGDLVVTAATGIEEEARQGVRIPLGEGFAGRIAAERTPVIIDDVDDPNVLSPILRDRGIRSLLGVPLVSEGNLVGVIHVGTLSPRRFTEADVEVLQLVADRVAESIDARQSRAERAAARALQRSLIPARLPAIPGLDLAGRYLPAGEGGVGGDWYDVFALPSGSIGVVMGDVIGRGLAAAVVMGRLRSALRAYALDEAKPHRVLERLDRKVQHFEAGQMTTVLYAVIDPRLTTFELSSAGHPLPMMVEPGKTACTFDAVVDPPLGVAPALSRHASSAEFPAGALLALYTDGLVERRDQPLEQGMARLSNALRADSAEESCAEALASIVGDVPLHDDSALLVIRRQPVSDERMQIEVPAVPTSLGRIRYAIRRWLASNDIGDDDSVNILLAVGEATANAVEHAYGPAGGTVAVGMERSGDTVVATVRDTGRWRLPRGTNRGRGVGIMEKCTEEMSLERGDEGTLVRLQFGVDRSSRS
jgi:putative methionine-R-sulfoxide reductase with GAF domain/anti-sigma regulatory factor (Ser/Thr protein kinase)